MKVFAFVVFALAVFGTKAAPKKDVDVVGDVTDAINNILAIISEPLIDIENKNFTLDLSIEKLGGVLTILKVGGIKALQIETLTFDDESSRLDYSLNFENIEAISDMDISLEGLIQFDHHPIAKVLLNNLRIAGYAVVDTVSSPNKVTDFKILVTLDKSQIEASGLLNNEDFSKEVSEILSKDLPRIVNDISAIIEPIVSPFVRDIINLVLKIKG